MNSQRFRQSFLSLNVRTKIILGILVTGGLALGIFTAFVARQANEITSALSNRLEASVSQRAEEQLNNTVSEQALLADQSFQDVRDEVINLAAAWTSLQEQKGILGQGSYWDAQQKLIQMEDGRYGNSPKEISSVYIPNSIEGDYTPYHVNVRASSGASTTAAVAQAAHAVLVGLFPANQAIYDTALANSLAGIPTGRARQGVAVGRAIAARVLQWRANDGSSAPATPYELPTIPGLWQPASRSPGGVDAIAGNDAIRDRIDDAVPPAAVP